MEDRAGNGEGREGAKKDEHDNKLLSKWERNLQVQKMLAERGVTVKSTWLQEIYVYVDDPLYLGLETHGDWKSAFTHFSTSNRTSRGVRVLLTVSMPVSSLWNSLLRKSRGTYASCVGRQPP